MTVHGIPQTPSVEQIDGLVCRRGKGEVNRHRSSTARLWEVRAAQGSIFEGYLRQPAPTMTMLSPHLADETPGAAMVEPNSLSTRSVAISDPCTGNADQWIHSSSSLSSSSEATSAGATASSTASAISSSSELARSTRISGASLGRILPTAPMAASRKCFGQ